MVGGFTREDTFQGLLWVATQEFRAQRKHAVHFVIMQKKMLIAKELYFRALKIFCNEVMDLYWLWVGVTH